MMENATDFSYFILSSYYKSGNLKYLYFVIVLCLYVLALCSNTLLIVVVAMNRSLHEPMYMFLCSLFVNELYGSTGLFPFLLLQLLSDTHTISVHFCFLQIFIMYYYGGVEYLNLAVMSYDRYLAICHPLQYNARMTSSRVLAFIAVTWLYSAFAVLLMLFRTLELQLCGNIINRIYCQNYHVVRLACSDITANNIQGLILGSISVFIPLLVIFYTYIRILIVCCSGSQQTRQKALSTCTPHLASILNFSFGTCFETIQSRFNMNTLPNLLRIVLSSYWVTCQPLFNPLMYGLNLTKIRILCKSLVFGQI